MWSNYSQQNFADIPKLQLLNFLLCNFSHNGLAIMLPKPTPLLPVSHLPHRHHITQSQTALICKRLEVSS